MLNILVLPFSTLQYFSKNVNGFNKIFAFPAPAESAVFRRFKVQKERLIGIFDKPLNWFWRLFYHLNAIEYFFCCCNSDVNGIALGVANALDGHALGKIECIDLVGKSIDARGSDIVKRKLAAIGYYSVNRQAVGNVVYKSVKESDPQALYRGGKSRSESAIL